MNGGYMEIILLSTAYPALISSITATKLGSPIKRPSQHAD